jgi:hypothetical protein
MMAPPVLPLRYGTRVHALRVIDRQVIPVAAFVLTTEPVDDGRPSVIVEFLHDSHRVRYIGDGIAECIQLD